MDYRYKISLRYLFAKKSANVINVISFISMLGILVGTSALLIVLSVFNGLHNFIGSLFGEFDPPLKIESAEGKVFCCSDSLRREIESCEGVGFATCVLADNALIKNTTRQMPCVVMGVDTLFRRVTNIDSITFDGSFAITDEAYRTFMAENDFAEEADMPCYCTIGFVLAQQIGAGSGTFRNSVMLYAPKRTGQINMVNPESSFIKQTAVVSGLFGVNQLEYDGKYVITSMLQARDLFCYDGDEVSYIGVKCADGANVEKVKQLLQERLGDRLLVKNQAEQHESFFKMMRIEKFMAYLILTFILAIAAFNIIGSLTMLIFEKKESIFILKAMGATRRSVTRIFLMEGLLISLGGAVLGLILGIILVLLQEHFGFVSFGSGEAYIINAYPVSLELQDVMTVFVTVIVVGFLAAWYPVRYTVRKYWQGEK